MTRSGHSRVVMLTRWPVPGRAKTRLIPALGAHAAVGLHRALAEHVALEVLALGATGEAQVEVWHRGGSRRRMRAWLGSLPRYRPQPGGGDLGATLAAVMRDGFRHGAGRCLAVGSDCPAMTTAHLRRALAALDHHDLVLGPAADGGYWLVGLRAAAAGRALPALFAGVAWGTAQVLRQTVERASAGALQVAYLDELRDVDTPPDLVEWARCRDVPAPAMAVSVVIPALDEQELVGAAIDSALRGGAGQVVVVDGGSRDATREVAARAGAVVIESARGRARQMNAGAARTSGDAIVFLHADTLLPPRAIPLVRQALAGPRAVAGAFAYRAATGGALGLVLTAGGRARCRLSGHPYGDQALFVRRRVFDALGGFPDLPVMEDWELVARLRRVGRVVVLPEAATTSAASFIDHGLLGASLVNLATIVGYRLGLDPHRLAAWRGRIARRVG